MFKDIKNYRLERARRTMESSATSKRSFGKYRLAAIICAVFALSAVIYAICFVNRQPLTPMLSKNKIAQIHIVSPFEFTYTSDIQTNEKRELSAARIPPLYKINPKISENAAGNWVKLVAFLNDNQPVYDSLSSEEKKDSEFFERLSNDLKKVSLHGISPDDIRTIYENTSEKNRENTFKYAAFHERNILGDGIYADGDAIFSKKNYLQTAEISGTKSYRALSETQARKELLDRIKTLGLNDALGYAIYRILNQDLLPNIEFDAEKTKQRRDEAKAQVQPVVVKVRAGETLVDSASSTSPIAMERYKAYKRELAQRGDGEAYAHSSRYIEFIACLLLVMSATLFITISKTQKNRQPRTVLIFSTLLILNLAAERFIIHLSNAEYFDTNTTFLQILVYGTPIMLGPIIMVLLFGSYTGFVMAILIAALTTMMIGESIVFFILFLASSLVAIYFCDGATSRSRVIFGGAIYGLFVATFSCIFGFVAGTDASLIWRQAILAVLAGSMTGILATAVLPIIERIFQCYSNIALIEYTDFNNPLLRRLQIEAPGTYHHSVMVSYLAEQAAAEVNANTMVCRIGALYHDIGKIVKPEFFSENQGGGKNLHDDQNPSMSALIIKNHIKEGVELAKLAKMPKQVIDAINQHHGTSIISYFYNKAMNMAESKGECTDPLQALRNAGIEESTYRHEGVKPKTVENAIIMLADSCEAASRSLKKITQHGVEDLVDFIVKTKMNDNQLDDCPITVKQLSKIKKSFVFTMLNMLHTRVEYNNAKKR